MTTRPPRPGEVDGVDYFFVDRDRFLAARDAGELLEWAEYSGHLYGTPRAQVEGPLAAGEDVLLDIELRGAEQVKAAFPEAVLVFVAPPSLEVLAARLRGRGDTGDEQVARRLAVAREQIAAGPGLVRPHRGQRRPGAGHRRGRRYTDVSHTPWKSFMMIEPPIETVLQRTENRFALVVLAARRARQINAYFHQLGDGLGSYVPPQVHSLSRKPLSIAFEEIAADKVIIDRGE